MSASEDHELMVHYLIHWLDNLQSEFKPQTISAECSLDQKIRTLPPNINGYRPDLFALSKEIDCCLIGEVETTKSLGIYHTEEQLRGFIKYIMSIGKGFIVLGVAWHNQPAAKSILRNIIRDENAHTVTPKVVDCSPILMQRGALWLQD